MSFTAVISKFESKAYQQAKQVRDDVVVDVAKDLNRQAPVDTGRFRSNWNTAVDDPDMEISERTINDAVQRAEAMVKYAPLESTIHHTNQLDYALDLERGTSRQAPAGWVRRTVAKFQRMIAKRAKEANR